MSCMTGVWTRKFNTIDQLKLENLLPTFQLDTLRLATSSRHYILHSVMFFPSKQHGARSGCGTRLQSLQIHSNSILTIIISLIKLGGDVLHHVVLICNALCTVSDDYVDVNIAWYGVSRTVAAGSGTIEQEPVYRWLHTRFTIMCIRKRQVHWICDSEWGNEW